MDGKQDYDVLGFIYEYLISMFAANAGKKAGEFYTPHEVSVLMSEIVANHLKDREHIKIYDPTSGSGSLLINIGASMAQYIEGENKIDYYAQELKENTYNLTRMNLVMRGINPANINHAGVPSAERRHHPGDPLIVAVIRRTDDNGAAVCAAYLGCGLFQPLLRKQQLTHRRQQLAAFRGGLHAAFGAVQQRKAQLLFQRCHAAADAGDRKPHLLRRRTQAAAVDCL